MRHLTTAAITIAVLLTILLIVFKTHTPDQQHTVPPVAQTNEAVALPLTTPQKIGTSVEGRPIELYTFGTGTTTILFVGGIHGGYEWNTVLLAQKFIAHFTDVGAPDGTKVAIIPNANPDGLFKVTQTEASFAATDIKNVPLGAGRFNANNVDLNRNFDCKWQATSTWRGNAVSAGTAPFSEPEARAIRDTVAILQPNAVIFWHSQANAVYASACEYGVLPGTLRLMNTYAKAAGYNAIEAFDAYPVTGDAEGWLASISIPAITVELSSHTALDWEDNLAGVTAILEQKSW